MTRLVKNEVLFEPEGGALGEVSHIVHGKTVTEWYRCSQLSPDRLIAVGCGVFASPPSSTFIMSAANSPWHLFRPPAFVSCTLGDISNNGIEIISPPTAAMTGLSMAGAIHQVRGQKGGEGSNHSMRHGDRTRVDGEQNK